MLGRTHTATVLPKARAEATAPVLFAAESTARHLYELSSATHLAEAARAANVCVADCPWFRLFRLDGRLPVRRLRELGWPPAQRRPTHPTLLELIAASVCVFCARELI